MNSIFAKISSRKNISNSLFAKFSSRENKVLYSRPYSISSGGRTDVRRHQESVRHARLGSTKGGMVQYVAHGQNEVDGVTNRI